MRTLQGRVLYIMRKYLKIKYQMLWIFWRIFYLILCMPKRLLNVNEVQFCVKCMKLENRNKKLFLIFLHLVAFQNGPLARTILGPEENILSIQRDDLINYIKTHYTPDRMVVAASGNVDHEQLVKLSEKYFGQVPNYHDAEEDEVRYMRNVFNGGTSVLIKRPKSQTIHFAIAVEGVSWSHPSYYDIIVLQQLLGNFSYNTGVAPSTKLAKVVSEKSLAKSYTSFNTCYRDTGLIGVFGETENEQLEELIDLIEQNWVRVGFDVTEEALEVAKSQVLTSILAQLDGTTSICEEIGNQILVYNRRIPMLEVLKRIDNVTIESVRRACTRYVYDQKPVLSVLGNIDKLPPKYHKIDTVFVQETE